MNHICIRKVKCLEGVPKYIAEDCGLDHDDLVILTVSLEKIIGSPISYLLKQIQSSSTSTKGEGV